MKLQIKKILLMCVLLLHAPMITAKPFNNEELVHEEQRNFFQKHKTAIIASTLTAVVIFSSAGIYVYKKGYIDSAPMIMFLNRYSQNWIKFKGKLGLKVLKLKESWSQLHEEGLIVSDFADDNRTFTP